MSQIWDIYCKHCLWSIFGPCWCTKSCKTTFYAYLSRIWKLARFTRFIRKVFATKILLSGKFSLFVTLNIISDIVLKLTGHHNWWKQGEGELDGEPTIFCLGQNNQAAKKTSRYPSAKGSTPPWGQGLGEGCCQSPFCNLSQSFCLLGHLLREDDPSQVSGILCWLIKIQWDWAWLPQTVQHHTHLCSCCSQN